MIGDQKGQLQSLLLIQTRVAKRSVVGGQVILVKTFAAAQALGDGVARQLKVHAAQVAALLLVDAQRLLELLVNVVEATSLDAGARRQGVAVHGVALPDDAAAVLGVLDGADVPGQELGNLASAVAGDEGNLASLALRVEGAQQGQEIVGGRRGPDLDADGVGNASEELDVGMVELPCAVADPQEMGRRVVVILCFGRGGLCAGEAWRASHRCRDSAVARRV